VFHTRKNVIIATGIASFCTVVGLTENTLRAGMYDDPRTQVSIDYVHHLEEICREEYYPVLSNK